MPKSTINDAIKEVFKRENRPLRVKEVFLRIKEDNLYEFKTETPEHVVRTALRRHNENLDLASGRPDKLYVTLNDGTYWLKDAKLPTSTVAVVEQKDEKLKSTRDNLLKLQQEHIATFKDALLKRLKNLTPSAFEFFCKELLKAYGFDDLVVTKASRDGGIDGYGQLKIGLSHLSVAFQCKRWNKSHIGRKEIQSFRGATVTRYQQALFFTTSVFTADAKKEAHGEPLGIPMVLFDGKEIVDIMIERQFGVEVQDLKIYVDALDGVVDKGE